jgi:hypothetical protein
MIRRFNFFRGIVGARVVSIGNVLNELYQDPPFGISRRHWNMLPQDLRGATPEEMDSFIQGWEDGRIVGVVNPYRDRIRRNLWNRGYLECNRRRVQNFRNVNPEPPIDETYPEYYNTDEFVFFDVTEVMTDPDSYRPYKFMLFRHIEEGNTVQGQRIYPEHPMWNFPNII